MTYILRQKACGNGVRTHTQGLKAQETRITSDLQSCQTFTYPCCSFNTSSCGFLTRAWWFPSEE